VKSRLNNQELAVVLADFRTFQNTPERIVNKLIKNFLPAIKQLTATYPELWKEDLIQEGKIALLYAARNFHSNKSVCEFFNYAYTAIKNRILNFYNSIIKKQPQTVELIPWDNDDDNNEWWFSFSDDYGVANNFDKAFDIKIQLTEDALIKAGLKLKEVKVFRSYFLSNNTLQETADELKLSVTQVSRLMNSARLKVKQILK
jgi:RNA polymerase sigma factor (sigma-70 family)